MCRGYKANVSYTKTTTDYAPLQALFPSAKRLRLDIELTDLTRDGDLDEEKVAMAAKLGANQGDLILDCGSGAGAELSGVYRDCGQQYSNEKWYWKDGIDYRTGSGGYNENFQVWVRACCCPYCACHQAAALPRTDVRVACALQWNSTWRVGVGSIYWYQHNDKAAGRPSLEMDTGAGWTADRGDCPLRIWMVRPPPPPAGGHAEVDAALRSCAATNRLDLTGLPVASLSPAALGELAALGLECAELVFLPHGHPLDEAQAEALLGPLRAQTPPVLKGVFTTMLPSAVDEVLAEYEQAQTMDLSLQAALTMPELELLLSLAGAGAEMQSIILSTAIKPAPQGRQNHETMVSGVLGFQGLTMVYLALQSLGSFTFTDTDGDRIRVDRNSAGRLTTITNDEGEHYDWVSFDEETGQYEDTGGTGTVPIERRAALKAWLTQGSGDPNYCNVLFLAHGSLWSWFFDGFTILMVSWFNHGFCALKLWFCLPSCPQYQRHNRARFQRVVRQDGFGDERQRGAGAAARLPRACPGAHFQGRHDALHRRAIHSRGIKPAAGSATGCDGRDAG